LRPYDFASFSTFNVIMTEGKKADTNAKLKFQNYLD